MMLINLQTLSSYFSPADGASRDSRRYVFIPYIERYLICAGRTAAGRGGSRDD